jgi:hypothetical protein
MKDKTPLRFYTINDFQVAARSSLCNYLITIGTDPTEIFSLTRKNAVRHFLLGDAVLREVRVVKCEFLHAGRILQPFQ